MLSDRHARSELGIQDCRTLSPSLPPDVFDARGSPLRSTSASRPGRRRRLGPAFCSPAKTTRFQAASTGSMLPAESFDLPAEPPSDPFSLRLPTPHSLRRMRRISTGDPLPHSLPAVQPLPRLSAPRRGFRPLRITALKRFRGQKPTVAVRPISLRSPPTSSLITAASGSSFQVRYVPPGSPFREPLGTITILH